MKEKIIRKQLFRIVMFSTLLLLPFAVKAEEPEPIDIDSVQCPIIGQKPTYVGGNTQYTNTYEERWVNLTDHKEMQSTDTFEANKRYAYEYGYKLKEAYYGRYLNYPPIEYGECQYSFGGFGSGSDNPEDFQTSSIGFYTGDFNNYAPPIDDVSFVLASPTIGGTQPTIQTNSKYRINSQKWVNTTDCRVMNANDVFEQGKKYKLIVNYSSFYTMDNPFAAIADSPYYLGNGYYLDEKIEHIGQTVVSAYFYFGNKEDLNIDGRVTLGGNKAPVAGQKISDFTITDNISYTTRNQYWTIAKRVSSSETRYETITDPNAVFEAGKTYQYYIYYELEPGYSLNSFEVTNNNKNNSFINEFDYHYSGSYGGYANYQATYQILENGKTFGITTQSSNILYPGQQAWLKVYPEEKEKEYIVWSSNNEEIATVSQSGWVEAIAPGNATITATDTEDATATYNIKVGTPVDSIVVPATLTMSVGDTQTLTAVLSPAETEESVRWEVDYSQVDYNYNISPVQIYGTGEIYAIRPGEIDIIATTDSGKSARCHVTVKEQAGVAVTSVALNKSNITLDVNETEQLIATIKPDNATDKNVIWISERPDVVSVENGLVKGLKGGTSTITVQTSNGKTATCTVKVKEYVNVTFYDSDATTVLKEATPYEKDSNASAIVKPNPNKENKILEGWYTDPELTQKYHFDGIIQDNLNLYAKWEDIRISIGGIPADVDFGEAYVNFDENIKREVVISNIGNVDVKLYINNPTSSGPFGSLSFDNGYVLKPGETYTAKLIAQAGGTSADKPGTYNGTYKITGKYVNDETKTTDFNIPATITLTERPISVAYKTHVQSYGWQDYVRDGVMSGTSGEAKRLEAIQIKLENSKFEGAIEYRTHIQSYGWEKEWKQNDAMSGTSGEAKRLEAIQIRLTDEVDSQFDVYYRVHAQSFGWLGWARNGEEAGTAGYAKRLEGIEIKLVPKGQAVTDYGELDAYKDKNAPESISLNQTNISIEAGDTTKLIAEVLPADITNKEVVWTSDNEDSVTVDQTGKITAVATGTATVTATTTNGKTATCNVNVLPPIPGVAYKTHVQSYGWQDYVSNGTMSGTSGEAKRLEAIQIKLKNQPFDGDIEYRTHIQSYGWEKEFKKNDDMSGTSGEAKRLEAIEINLTGEMAEKFDIYYRVHAQSFGWLAWAKNGEQAGTAGFAKRLEGIEIVLVDKDQQPPVRDNQNNDQAFIQNA